MFHGVAKVRTPSGDIVYQAVYSGEVAELQEFIYAKETDEMSQVRTWNLVDDIGYVDEVDLAIVKLVFKK